VIVAVCAIALAFGFFGSMPLAGPIAIMVVSRAAQKKYGEGLRIGLGAAAAEGIYAGVAFFGFTTLLARHPIVVPVSHAVTALVLVALGIRFAVWKPKNEPHDDNERRAGTVFVGFSLSALNPTLLVTWSAAVAFLYSKGLGNSSAVAAVPFGACAAVGVGGWFAILTSVLRRFEGKLPEHVFTWTIRVLGGVLVGLGVWSGVQFVQWLHGDRRSPTQATASLCSVRADDGPGDRARHRRGDRDA
jgi:threonine/homoserine/homoserine lactone efflux protein